MPEDSVTDGSAYYIEAFGCSSECPCNTLVAGIASAKYCIAVLVLLMNTMLSSDFMGIRSAKGAEGQPLLSSRWYIGSTVDRAMIVRPVAQDKVVNSPENILSCTC